MTGIELRTRVSGLKFNTYRGVASEIYQTSKLLNLGRVCSNLLAKLKISCDYWATADPTYTRPDLVRCVYVNLCNLRKINCRARKIRTNRKKSGLILDRTFDVLQYVQIWPWIMVKFNMPGTIISDNGRDWEIERHANCKLWRNSCLNHPMTHSLW